jgi:fatty acid desaturase
VRPESAERDPSLHSVLDRTSLAEEVRRLSVVSGARSVALIGLQWLVIGLAVSLALWSESWAVWLLAAMVCATRQHALLVLMHEGAHYRLLSSRRANDLVSDVFCAFPMGICTHIYRLQHFEHHRFTGGERDPERIRMKPFRSWQWPKSRREALIVLAGDAVGREAVMFFGMFSLWSPWPYLAGLRKRRPISAAHLGGWLGFVLLGGIGLTLTGGWVPFVLLWVWPALSLLGVLFRIRALGEHAGMPATTELDSTRDVLPTLLERLTVAPLHVSYHLTHHLFPSVPQHHLPAMHALLMKDPVFRERATPKEGYRSVLAELTQTS